LVSGDLVGKLSKSDALTFTSLGKMELEGRQEVVELFAHNNGTF
jgi:hypothetical protein